MTDTPTKRPPDHPPVPRPHGKFLFVFATIISLGIVGGYAAFASTQRELGADERDEIPSSVRSTPGGYRSYSYWHSGYHGGK